MPIQLSAEAILHKNKLGSTGVWVTLVECLIPVAGAQPIRLCNNSEEIIWNGHTWMPFPFELDRIPEVSKNEKATVNLRVGNITRTFQLFIEQYDGIVDSDVNIYIVNTNFLHVDEPERSAEFKIMGTNADPMWVTFELGASDPYRRTFPANRILRDVCRWNRFKNDECKYTGPATECNRSLARCVELNNSVNFGGFPGVAGGTVVIQ